MSAAAGDPCAPRSTLLRLRIADRALLAGNTACAAGADPVLLDQIIGAAQSNVEIRAVANRGDCPVLVCALVAVLVAVGEEPGIEVRIGSGFLGFVGDNRNHGVHAGIVVGAM